MTIGATKATTGLFPGNVRYPGPRFLVNM